MTDSDDIVPLQDFTSVGWQAPLVGTKKADPGDLADLFAAAAKAADEAGDERESRVFWLLFHVCNIVLDTSDPATAFRARLVLTDGRSAEPADYRGAQSEVFATLLGETENPGLRARLGDIVWTNNRKARDAALVAGEAYSEVVEGLLAETYDEAVPGFGRSTYEQVTLAHRALQISRATLKGNAHPDRAVAAAKAVYERASSCGEHVVFIQIAGVMVSFGLMEDADIARDAEIVASGNFVPGHAMAVQCVWDFAAQAYAAAKDGEAERRCRLRSVDMTLERARSTPSALIAAHWLRVAIEALRHTRDTKPQRNALMLELRERQLEARDEFRPKRQWIDVQNLAKATIEALGHDDPSTLLRAFTRLTGLADPKVIRDQAVEALRGSPLSGLFGGNHSDVEGKTVAETPAFGFGDELPEARIDEQIDQIMGASRRVVVGGMIQPTRDVLINRHAFAERHFWPIVELSPFVPPEQESVFSLGFARFLQGDMMSAAHLLLPQIEPALRYILATHGHEPTIIKSDMLQEDQTLAPLLTNFRQELESIFGPEIVFEIDILFNKKPGPRLRHEFAHGKISASRCFSPEVIYACWLIFHVAAFPLLEHWDEVVAPTLARIEGDPSALKRKA